MIDRSPETTGVDALVPEPSSAVTLTNRQDASNEIASITTKARAILYMITPHRNRKDHIDNAA